MNGNKKLLTFDRLRVILFLLVITTLILATLFNALMGTLLGIISIIFYLFFKKRYRDLENTYRDLLSTKEAHLNLLESQVLGITPKEFIQSLRGSPAGQAILTKDLKFVFVNRSFWSIFNFKDKFFAAPDDLEGEEFFTAFPSLPATNKRFSKALERCVTKRAPYLDSKFRLLDENGYEYYCDWAITPINSDKVLITVVDKTEEFKNYMVTKKRKEQYSRFIDTFIKDPEAAIKMYNEELISELSGEY